MERVRGRREAAGDFKQLCIAEKDRLELVLNTKVGVAHVIIHERCCWNV